MNTGGIAFQRPYTMFTSFFKVAVRILMRDRIQTLLKISGLAIGIAFSLIIFLYVHQETSYDRFHRNANRIFRVAIHGQVSGNTLNHAVTPAPLAGAMIREIPGVENAVRVAHFGAWLVRYKNVRNNEDHIIFSDTSFFSVFSFPLLRGKASEVLREPNSIVLSESKAKLYFGDADPVGKWLRIENDTTYYKVTGIMADVPEISHLHFDMVGSLSTFQRLLSDDRWIVNYLYTYVLVKPGYERTALQSSLHSLVMRYVVPEYKQLLGMSSDNTLDGNDTYQFMLQPLTDIHLKSNLNAEIEPVGDILYIYIFTALAIAILVLSCINFISLATARSIDRAREVSVRKIVGSERITLVRQFLIESSVLAILSMALALFITELALPVFDRYMNLDLKLSQLLNSSGVLLMVGLILIIGLVSGIIPAMHYASFEPLAILRNHNRSFSKRSYFRIGLVWFQLFVTTGVMTLTCIILGQYHFLIHKNLGFQKENLVVIRRPDGLKDKLEAYKQTILKYPGVLAVTNTTSIPGSPFSRTPFYLKGSSAEKNYAAANLMVSFGFDSTYRITMQQGRFFQQGKPGDSAGCVINESMANLLGVHGLTGKELVQMTDKPNKKFTYKILGIVQDFNFEPLDSKVFPLVMVLMPGNFEGYITVRLKPGDPNNSIRFMKDTWGKYTTAYPFVYFFLDQDLKSMYNGVRETGRIFTLLSLVALLIACLGLFGLISYAGNRRGYEFGVRKVMGADARNIVLEEFRHTLLLLIIASIVAWIGVIVLVKSWLSAYAYKITLNGWYFLIPFLFLLLVALVTIFLQIHRVAHENPAPAMKYE